MGTNLQTIIVMLVVGTAVIYLARRAFSVWRGNTTGGCGSCSGCSTTSGKQLPIVELNDGLSAAKRTRQV